MLARLSRVAACRTRSTRLTHAAHVSGRAVARKAIHKLRAGLSVLGIVIGTAAVIILMGFGKGSMEDALEDIRSQGTTNIIVRSVEPVEESSTGQRRSWVVSYGLTWDDYDRCRLLGSVVGPSSTNERRRHDPGRRIGEVIWSSYDLRVLPALSEMLGQARGAFDVGEEEGDCARG